MNKSFQMFTNLNIHVISIVLYKTFNVFTHVFSRVLHFQGTKLFSFRYREREIKRVKYKEHIGRYISCTKIKFDLSNILIAKT